MHHLPTTSAALSVGLLLAAPAFAGGWAQQPGDVYVKVWNRTLVGSRAIVTSNKSVVLDEGYQDHQLQVYTEVGLKQRLTWIGHAAPVGLASYGTNRTAYVGPASTGVRVGLVEGDSSVFSAQFTVGGRLPVGATELFRGEIDGEPVVVRPTLGTLQGDVELQYGSGFRRGWLAIETGARGFTSGVYNPAVYARAQVGWKPNERWVLDLHIPVHSSLGAIDETDVLGVTNTRYLGFGLTGSYWISKSFAITSSFEGVARATSNAGTPSLNLGVEFKRHRPREYARRRGLQPRFAAQ
ncbi:MAG: hypothetical protein AB8H79_10310 [Myxococcota bacterium]